MTYQKPKHFPRRRTVLKWMHWGILPLFIWFLFMTPSVVLRLGGSTLFTIHSNLALLFVTLCLIWTAMHLRKGLASRPGPKLPRWAQIFHRRVHTLIIWGLFGVAITGFLLGLTSAVLLKAGGFLPIAPPLDLKNANEIIGQIHIFEYYILAAIIAAHATFHIWRHVVLKDNALRIMAPKAIHRFL